MQLVYQPTPSTCLIAALCSILEQEVPERAIDGHDGSEGSWRRHLAVIECWLFGLGLIMHEFRFSDERSLREANLDCYHVKAGQSPRGNLKHAVVGFDSTIVHDPFEGASKPHLVGDPSEWVYTFIVPVNPALLIHGGDL